MPVTVPIERLRSEVFDQFPTTWSGGIFNCRKIAGTNTWSQHAWGNALDIMVPSRAVGDEVYAWLAAGNAKRLGLRRIWTRSWRGWRWALWRQPAHFDHLHVEGKPKRTGTPPCAGGTLPPQEDDMFIRGDSGVDVQRLQESLNNLGFTVGAADGEYGPATSAGVAAFKAHVGYAGDGDSLRDAWAAEARARDLDGGGGIHDHDDTYAPLDHPHDVTGSTVT